MSSGPALALVPHAPAERGRLLSIEDVQALFPAKPNGQPSKSRWFVTHDFCPEGKMKIGRHCYWWEQEAIGWIDAQRGAA